MNLSVGMGSKIGLWLACPKCGFKVTILEDSNLTICTCCLWGYDKVLSLLEQGYALRKLPHTVETPLCPVCGKSTFHLNRGDYFECPQCHTLAIPEATDKELARQRQSITIVIEGELYTFLVLNDEKDPKGHGDFPRFPDGRCACQCHE